MSHVCQSITNVYTGKSHNTIEARINHFSTYAIVGPTVTQPVENPPAKTAWTFSQSTFFYVEM
jgi:hypothetical protein